MEYIFTFSLSFFILNSVISRILRAVYHIMKYRQPCKPPTYYIFFLSPLQHRGISVFICFPRQTALVPLGLPSRCTRWIPLVMESSNNAGKLACGIIGPRSQDRARFIHLLDVCLEGFKSRSPWSPWKYPSNWWP